MKKFISKLVNTESSAALMLILPAVVGTFIFIIIPVLCSFGLSFAKWDLLGSVSFVGLDNYRLIFSEKIFYKILTKSEFYKTAYFLPFITPMIVIGIIWEWIFDPNIGLLNTILHIHIKWLYDTTFAMPALIIVSVWKLIGYNMIIFLSGLSGISQSLFEAAKIDGANSFQIFKKVTVPMLSPTIFFVVIITAISSFQVFDLIYLMTSGGPLDSTNVLVYAIYKNAFEYFNAGKASALAYVLFTIILVLTLIQWNLRKKLVYSEE